MRSKSWDKLISAILTLCFLLSMMSGFTRVEAKGTRTPIEQVAHNPAAIVVPGSNEMLRIQKSIKQTNKDEFTITLTADTKEEVKGTGVSVVLLVDQSGSMNDGTPKKIDSLKEASQDFVNTLFPEGEVDSPHQLGIVEFHDYGFMRLGFTNDKASMLQEIDELIAYPQATTNIVDGLQKAKELLDNAKTGNKKVVVFLGDGQPTVGGDGSACIAKAEEIKASGVDIYSIFLNVEYVDNEPGMSAAEIVTGIATGDHYYEATDGDALAEEFVNIADELVKEAKLWRVIDPMGEFISFDGYVSSDVGASFDHDTKVLEWNLLDKAVTPEPLQSDANGFTHRYRLKYKIGLDVNAEGFEDGKRYATNGNTTLAYYIMNNNLMSDPQTATFEVPQVVGYSKKTILVTAANLIAYVGGDSQSADPFPYPRFHISGNDTDDRIEDLEFYVDGVLYNWLGDPHYYEFPFEESFYYIDPVTREPAADPSPNDDIPGDYLIRVQGLEGATITAKSKLDGETYQIVYDTGTLYVRGVTEVVSKTDALTEAPQELVEAPMVTIPENLTVTDSTGRDLTGTASIALLCDDLLFPETVTNMQERLAANPETQNSDIDFMYLDLVDSQDGNLVLYPDKEVTIYLPYPAGTDGSYQFKILHLPSVNRQYDYELTEVQSEWITPSKTKQGLKFSVNSFSPFALAYEKPSGGVGGGGGGGGGGSGGGQTPVQLTVVKVDDKTGAKLPGAQFELWKEVRGGNDVRLGSYQTTQEGTFTIESLPEGAYYLIETIPPVGYRLLKEPYRFFYGGRSETMTIGNQKSQPPNPLNEEDHIAYMIGYPNGRVMPEGSITRAEVITAFYRLLDKDYRDEIFTIENPFLDVTSQLWYHKAVSSMANGGYLQGYPDHSLQGDQRITRAEFVSLAARFVPVDSWNGTPFADMDQTHWAYPAVMTALGNGWLQGYPDSSFRPDQPVTRAEAVVVINRMLDRKVNETGLITGFKFWPDNKNDAWYYYDVIEATNSHTYRMDSVLAAERWTAITQNLIWYDKAKYEDPVPSGIFIALP